MLFEPKMKLYVSKPIAFKIDKLYKDIEYVERIAEVLADKNASSEYINELLNTFSQKERALVDSIKSDMTFRTKIDLWEETSKSTIRKYVVEKYKLDDSLPSIKNYLDRIMKKAGITKWYNVATTVDRHNDIRERFYSSTDIIANYLKRIKELDYCDDRQDEIGDAILEYGYTIGYIISFFKRFLDVRLRRDRKRIVKYMEYISDEMRKLGESD